MHMCYQTIVLRVAWMCLSFAICINCSIAQVPQDPANAMRESFERFAKQSDAFMPGMFSELSDEDMRELEKISVSIQEENKFGKQVLENYETNLRAQNRTITRRGAAVNYLSQLIARIVPKMKNAKRYPRMDVAVVDSEMIDAYSIPGGHLIFTEGLLSDVQSEAELMGVICHELSHLDRGHQLLSLKQAKRSNQLTDLRSGMKWMATTAKPFRPEFETQADEDAVKWMLDAGYDARELAKLLARWSAKQDAQAGWIKMVPSFAKSHPDADRRAQAVLDAVDQANVDVDQLIVGKENLATQTPHPIAK